MTADRLRATPAGSLFSALRCLLFGHDWIRHEGGHVHAGDDWSGDWHNGHPWSFAGVRNCLRCGRSESL